MTRTGAELVSYIIINERSPGMPILYASSSIRHAFLYEPYQLIGCSLLDFVADVRDIDEIKKHYETYTNDNVIMSDLFLKNKDGDPVFIRSVAFSCDNVHFHMARYYPNIAFDQHQGRRMVFKRFKCILSDSIGGSLGSRSTEQGGLNSDIIYSMRSAYQACIVLEGINPNRSSVETGPRVIFSTNSISRIIDIDSCDIQGLAFLSLVATEDILKAATFLENVLNSDELVLSRLLLRVNPVSSCRLERSRSVSVEFMAMGSDDGAVMLCQLERPRTIDNNSSNKCMSLEEIVSSDPDTSDFQECWNRLPLS